MELTLINKSTKDVYSLNISPSEGCDLYYRVEIIFEQGEFLEANYPFRGKYTQQEWQTLKLIAEKIEEIAKSYKEEPYVPFK